MIEEKKIEEAAQRYSNVTDANKNEASLILEGFKEGVHWFKKSLWHDASEEPEKGRKLVGYDLDGYSIYCWTDQEATWKEFVYNSTLQKWCYVDDLLPKEGGEG